MSRSSHSFPVVVALAVATVLIGVNAPATTIPEDAQLSIRHDARVKAIVLLHKREGMSWDEYERYYLEQHPAFIYDIPGLRGWVVNIAVHGEEPAPYDGIAEFWFDDMEAFATAMASEEVAAALADAEHFVAPPGPQLMVVAEHVMVSPARY